MIDHVSIAVRDITASARFYETVLATLGYSKIIVRPGTIGFGKKYPEFWLNERATMAPIGHDSGSHFCLRAPDRPAVDAFHAASLAAGGSSDGPPGLRPEYTEGYYAAFIKDLDGNKIEAVTFVQSGA